MWFRWGICVWSNFTHVHFSHACEKSWFSSIFSHAQKWFFPQSVYFSHAWVKYCLIFPTRRFFPRTWEKTRLIFPTNWIFPTHGKIHFADAYVNFSHAGIDFPHAGMSFFPTQTFILLTSFLLLARSCHFSLCFANPGGTAQRPPHNIYIYKH